MTKASPRRTSRTDLAAPSQKEIDHEARLVWAKTAEAVANDFNATFDKVDWAPRIAASPLAACSDSFPHDEPERVLGFSLFVTETAVRQVLSDVEDPSRLLFLASRLAEFGMYSFMDPRDPSRKLTTHLAASKSLGYFFTPPEVALAMAQSVFNNKRRIGTILDPAAGLGSLLGATILHAHQSGIEITRLQGYEVDPFTVRLADQLIQQLNVLLGATFACTVEQCDAIERLTFEIEQDAPPYDGIVLNPPYGRVKFLRSSLTNLETIAHMATRHLAEEHQKLRTQARERAAHLGRISKALGLGAGEQNLQRLFIAMSHRRLSGNGRMSVISPSSWLGDRDGEGLRRRLVRDHAIESIVVYPEDSGLFATVNQVTAVATLTPPSTRESISMQIMGRANGNSTYAVDYARLQSIDPGHLRIPRLDRRRAEIFDHLQSQRRLADLTSVKNARGELDLTAHRRFISSAPTQDRLIRGDHIERYVVRPADYSPQSSFVEKSRFLLEGVTPSKAVDIPRRRIASRQVSYLNKPRRLSFSLVPEGSVLGNSCNYLTTAPLPEEDDILHALLAIFNSVVVEWFFRVCNANNHVANYEIDEFPVWPEEREIRLLAQWGRYLTQLYASGTVDSRRAAAGEDFCDALVCHVLGLESSLARQVVDDVDPPRALRVSHLVNWLAANGVPDSLAEGVGWAQHRAPSLSEHDLEVASYVPQGGNWQDIPEDVPSKRLEQIRQMTIDRGGAVRTSYYGRLRPDQPAYTIATYFNRPGNGTNLVPWVDRTLTTREAARLQSFPDWYLLVPSEIANRKHVGNAVPPLLAYAVGKHVAGFVQSRTAIDLFAGAGGLSLGLELAGWDVAVAVDNDDRALKTYSFNRPSESIPDHDSRSTLVLCQDLSDESERTETVARIRDKVGQKPIGLLVGGPPCQGFSTAGWRLKQDDRNDLAVAFMEFVDDLKPECVIVENVEGLLNYRHGAVIHELLGTLRELGYRTGSSPWVLAAEQYGVPQMRRRIFLVGHRDRDPAAPPRAILDRCLGRREFKKEAGLFDDQARYPVTVAEAIGDLPRLGAITHGSMGVRPVRPWFERWAKGEISVDQFLTGLQEEIH